jgi:hypothetical protein
MRTHTHTLSLSLSLFSAILLFSPLFLFDIKTLATTSSLSIEIQISTYSLVLISKVTSIQNYSNCHCLSFPPCDLYIKHITIVNDDHKRYHNFDHHFRSIIYYSSSLPLTRVLNYAPRVINYACKVMIQIVASLMIVIYNC